MCKYCEQHAQIDGYDVDFLLLRKPSKYNYGVYTGISAYIDVDSKELELFACIDNENIKPVYVEARMSIKYCPACGRDLDEESEK